MDQFRPIDCPGLKLLSEREIYSQDGFESGIDGEKIFPKTEQIWEQENTLFTES